jgi:hypothetical protein
MVRGDLARGCSGARGFEGRLEKSVIILRLQSVPEIFTKIFSYVFSKIAMHAAA